MAPSLLGEMCRRDRRKAKKFSKKVVIGIKEHPGRIRGLGRGVDFKIYFRHSQSSIEKMSKRLFLLSWEKREKWDRFLEEERERLW